MGSTLAKCTPVNNPFINLGILGWSITFMCDEWATSHIITPLFIAAITFDPLNSWHLAGYWEMLEIFMLTVFGSFIIFITGGTGDPMEDSETLVMIFLEDWLIQGSLGALFLGSLYLNLTRPPRLLRSSDLWEAPRFFWFYILTVIVYVAPFVVFSLKLSNGFRIGEWIVIVWQLLWPLIVIALESATVNRGSMKERRNDSLVKKKRKRYGSDPRSSFFDDIVIFGKWEGRKNYERIWFWYGLGITSFCFFFQGYFSWMLSQGIQSWIMTVVAAAVYLIVHMVIYREGPDLLFFLRNNDRHCYPRLKKNVGQTYTIRNPNPNPNANTSDMLVIPAAAAAADPTTRSLKALERLQSETKRTTTVDNNFVKPSSQDVPFILSNVKINQRNVF